MLRRAAWCAEPHIARPRLRGECGGAVAARFGRFPGFLAGLWVPGRVRPFLAVSAPPGGLLAAGGRLFGAGGGQDSADERGAGHVMLLTCFV